MPTMNWYNLDLTQFPKDFVVGDRCRVFQTNGRSSSESWTKILGDAGIRNGEQYWIVEGHPTWENGRRIDSVLIVSEDDLKTEAQSTLESMLYHQEEFEAGVL